MKPKLSLKATLILSMIAAGILPMLVSGVVLDRQAANDLERIAYDRLRGEAANKKAFLESYVDTVTRQNASMAGKPWIAEALRQFDVAYDSAAADAVRELGALPGDEKLQRFYEREFLRTLEERGEQAVASDRLRPKSAEARLLQHLYIADNPEPLGEKDAMETSGAGIAYDWQHKRYHATLRDYQKRFELYDVFLIEPEEGNIVYSVFKEIDYATSLFNGPYRDSGLAAATREALRLPPGEVALVDFSTYLPSYQAGASFVASPVYEEGRLVGALAFQMPLGRINAIMTAHDGDGVTDESLLVGADRLRRSQSRFTTEDTVLRETIDSVLVDRAIGGESGVVHEEFGGEDHLVAYTPVTIGELSWALITRVQTDEALAAVAALTRTLTIVTAVAALLVAMFALWLGNRLYRTLGGDPQDIRRVAEAIEGGDLSDAPGDTDKVGAYAAIVRMRARLREVLHEAHGIAEEVRNGAAELSAGNVGLSERTEQQASNLEETASSTEELTSTVKQNAENARAANELAIDTRQRATASGEVAANAVHAMQDINASSERIADIIGVIDEIAFQTNLLALNAAVEAARAGEQGRGFAVVASEVRQLAGRSASAAKEIKELIEDSVQKVRDGTGLVRESGKALEEIVGSVASLTDIVGQITVASDEQAIGIEQINQALVHMDSVTQQNTALVEEATATSRSMSGQAELLSSRISYFSNGDGAANAAAVPSAGTSVDTAASKATRGVPIGANVTPLATRAGRPGKRPDAERAPLGRVSGGEEFWEEF